MSRACRCTSGCTRLETEALVRLVSLTTRALTVLRSHFLVLLMLRSDPATNLHWFLLGQFELAARTFLQAFLGLPLTMLAW